MTLPPGSIPPGPTRVLLALIDVYRADRRATVRSVAARAGLTVAPTWEHLRALSEAGLVGGLGVSTSGALRPLVDLRRTP